MPYKDIAKRRRYSAAWRKRNARRYLELQVQIYGLSLADYDKLFKLQDGKCAICQKKSSTKQRLNVDHCHRTGKVRGLLCQRCNSWLLAAIEDPLYKTALQYLEAWRSEVNG